MAKYGILEQSEGGLKGGLCDFEKKSDFLESFSLINRLKEFITTCCGKDDLTLNEVSGQFIRDFDFWLKTEKKMQHNFALKHLKMLKEIVRIALANGVTFTIFVALIIRL